MGFFIYADWPLVYSLDAIYGTFLSPELLRAHGMLVLWIWVSLTPRDTGGFYWDGVVLHLNILFDFPFTSFRLSIPFSLNNFTASHLFVCIRVHAPCLTLARLMRIGFLSGADPFLGGLTPPLPYFGMQLLVCVDVLFSGAPKLGGYFVSPVRFLRERCWLPLTIRAFLD